MGATGCSGQGPAGCSRPPVLGVSSLSLPRVWVLSALRAAGRCASRTGCSHSASASQRLTRCETEVDAAYPAPCTRVCDMCGRPLRSKRNLRERCGPWSGADMCAAFDAAHMPQAQMGVRRSGPSQAHALEALVAKLVFLIRSLDRSAIPLL